jgi:S-DNA-T family DNA segregation ATPase FtsK/SpoIIIE
MNRQQLEGSADAIERVLSQHQTPAQVRGGHVTPRAVIFDVSPQSAESAARIEELSNTIAVALGVPHAKVTRSGGAVRIDVPRSDAQPVQLARMLSRIPADRVPFCTALLGLADDGAPLLARFPSPEVGHVMISGHEGSGKTSLIVAMLLSLAYYNKPRHVQLVAIGSGFDGLRDLPHMLQADDLQRLINRPSPDPRIIVAVDEPRADLLPMLATFAVRGAAAGVHCIVASRAPVDLPIDVKITADQRPGDFWAEYSGQVMRFDAAHICGADLSSFIQAIQG